MMQYLLIMLPPSIVGLVAIVLCLAPRSGMAAESSETLVKTSNAATLAASGNAVYLGFNANEIAAIGGLVVAVISLIVGTVVNVWFKYQHLEIARARVGALLCETCDKRAEAPGDE